jgi:hypothetical protein
MFALLTYDSTSRDTYRSTSRSEENRPAASRYDSPSAKADAPARTATPSSGGSYASYKTPEERAAFIKQQAEQRMAERLAALGIKAPVKAGETPQQRAEREKREREEKLRQAEEEDARREEERQRRLNDESGAPPVITKGSGKKPAPPPPASRKNKVDVAQHDVNQAEAESKRAENDIAEKALRDQQEAQEAGTNRMVYVHLPCQIETSLTAALARKNVDKKTTWPRSVRPLKLDFVHSKNKYSRAS